jgi:hypothetical protein
MTAKSPSDRGLWRVRVPADLDRPDPILAGLSARQLAILAGFGLAAWTLANIAEPLPGFPAATVVVAPLLLAGITLGLGWRDGRPLDQLALAALAWCWQPRRRVLAPGGLTPIPGWAGPRGPRLAPVTGPVTDLTADGILELAGAGYGLVCAASPVNLGLRSPAEQHQLLAGFARLLHALGGPMQVLVRNQPADLSPLAVRLRRQTATLAHPALEEAALAYAGWLEQLGDHHQARHRELLVIFRHPHSGRRDAAAAALARQVEQATELLAAAGVTLTVLDADAAGRVLAAATSPSNPPPPAGLAPAATVITGAQP